MNEIVLMLAGEHTGRAHSYRDGVLFFVCDVAFAPGQPFVATIASEPGPLEIRGKAASSKLRDDGAFDVRVKLHSLRREQRNWLETNLPSSH